MAKKLFLIAANLCVSVAMISAFSGTAKALTYRYNPFTGRFIPLRIEMGSPLSQYRCWSTRSYPYKKCLHFLMDFWPLLVPRRLDFPSPVPPYPSGGANEWNLGDP